MTKSLFAGAVLALVSGMAGDAGAQPPARSDLQISFSHEVLANGLTVVYHVDSSAPLVAVNVWYNVGSRHEQEGRTGLAHLFEHILISQGSRNIPPGQRVALLERAGGRSGIDINGTTNNDRTNYFQQLPSNQVELALWLEADHMRTTGDVLTQEALDAQREVVKNERRERYENAPYGAWQPRMLELAFPEGHPYRHAPIGSMADLSAQTLEDVKAFFRAHYSPDNAVLVVAGDIELARTRAMVHKYFASIPRGSPRTPPRPVTVPLVLDAPVREVLPDPNARAPGVYVGMRMPPERAEGSAAVTLLTAILGSGSTSHLQATMVRERQVATSAAAGTVGLVDGADLMIAMAFGRPGSSADTLEAELHRALDAAIEAITPEQLSRVKAAVRHQFVQQLQTMGGFGGRADRLAEGQTFYGDAGWVNRRLVEMNAVTIEQIRALATRHLSSSNRITLVFTPSTPQRTAQE